MDAHNHLDLAYGGGFIQRDAQDLLDVLDDSGIDHLVDLAGYSGERDVMRHLNVPGWKTRVSVVGGLDWHQLFTEYHESDWAAEAIKRLGYQRSKGIRAVKVWKDLGMLVVSRGGRRPVPINSPHLKRIWRWCGEVGLPVVWHVGDPPPFFLPPDQDNPRRADLLSEPSWQHWQRGVSLNCLRDQFSQVVTEHRRTVFVGAHALDLFDDMDRLVMLLRDHPNLHIDTGARFGEIEERSRDFARVVERYPKRILFGLDHPPSALQYRVAFETVSRCLSFLPGSLRSLAMDSVMARNAERVFRNAR